MATTALVTEILIVGLQAEAWIAMFVLAAFGTGWVDLGGVQSWAALVTILVLATAYVLGIVVDRLADSALGLVRGPNPAGFAQRRLEVLHRSPGMAPFLEYQRSRLRIARGTLFNLVVGTVAAVAFVLRGVDVGDAWALAVLAVAALAIAATWVAASRIGDAYEKRLLDAYSIVKQGGAT